MNTAAFIHGAGDIRVESYNPESAADGYITLDVASVGICGSDIHYFKDGGIGSAMIEKPFIPGHEFSARVRNDIESIGIKRGELVAVDPAVPCHRCEWCARGHHNLCPNVMFFGAPPYNGAMTQTISVPEACIVRLPSGMTADQGAMLEPLGVCIHAIDLATPQLVESVAVIGCGAIGLGIIQLLTLSTAGSIIAVDPQQHRANAALSMGATAAGNSLDIVLDNTNGLGCALVIEATNSPAALQDACMACKIGGRLVMVGIPDGNFYQPLDAAEARRRALNIKFSRRMGDVYPRAIKLVRDGQVDVDALVSHHFDLEKTPDAFAMQVDQADGLIKSMLRLA